MPVRFIDTKWAVDIVAAEVPSALTWRCAIVCERSSLTLWEAHPHRPAIQQSGVGDVSRSQSAVVPVSSSPVSMHTSRLQALVRV
ncbi:hypothetical protein DIJ64_07210 [Mycobacterium leprae]|uniref:Uncharacterized protein n=1 Tax=Mycobacterium leprae TaxID=1769 RepID=A0AAD0KVE5_MYCLR|nr:hypothetical protein [Mycobacterium leprae]AWV47935.1 hypothetical protein DIJ64_07210 [Mycobacterium leprae]OAR20096.1 hypothetical protein A8144_12310 [Mycobacterium leprae 3125609]OAX70467.1 hypothetical protein A3216_11790 [Mycobacterium leprae 7935681]